MKQTFVPFIFFLFSALQGLAQAIVIDAKGTKVPIDTGKWELTGTNIYNKNTGSVGIGTSAAANSDALLEVNSTNKGLLIPRLALASSSSPAPLVNHVAGMIIYNTASVADVSPGIYYNDGSNWRKSLNSSAADTTNDAWINDAANQQVTLASQSNGTSTRGLGTEFVIKDNGRVGIGTTAPSWMLDVRGPSAIGQFKRYADYFNNSPGFLFSRAKGTPKTPTDIQSGDFLGKVQFRGLITSTDTDFGTFAYIANSTIAGDGYFSFLKGSGSQASDEVMSVNTNTGNVSIGNTSSNSRLNISGYVRLGTTDGTADALSTAADRAGMVRYNSTSRTLQYHDNSNWKSLTGSTAAADTTNDAWVNDNANQQVRLASQSNGTTARAAGTEMVIKDNGKVGIGTSSPVSTLHIRNGDFRLENDDNWNGYKGVTYSESKYPQLFLFKARGNRTSPLYPQSTNTMGGFKVANAVDSAGGAGFRVNSTETQSANAHGSSVIIFTTPNGTSDNLDRLIIDHNGNVGIGDNDGINPITNPNAKLQVNTLETATYTRIANFYAPGNTTAGNASVIAFGISNSTRDEAQLRYIHQGTNNSSNRFDIGWNGIVAPSVSVLAGGNVGIGTTTPSAALEVNGTMEITTVNNVTNNVNYKPLVWNTSSQRVETTDDDVSVKLSVSVSSGATGNLGSPLTASSGGAGYEIKILIVNGCGATTYNKFMATGSTAGNWRIGFIGGISQNGPSSGTSSGNGSTVTVSNPLSAGCADGGNTTAFNYTINISNSGQISITNSGNISRIYSAVAEKVIE